MAVQLSGTLCPVNQRFGFLDLVGVSHPLGRLRLGRQRQFTQRHNNQLRPEPGQAVMQRH